MISLFLNAIQSRFGNWYLNRQKNWTWVRLGIFFQHLFLKTLDQSPITQSNFKYKCKPTHKKEVGGKYISMKWKNLLGVFQIFRKNGKFWSIFLGYFIKHKPRTMFSENWYTTNFWTVCNVIEYSFSRDPIYHHYSSIQFQNPIERNSFALIYFLVNLPKEKKSNS